MYLSRGLSLLSPAVKIESSSTSTILSIPQQNNQSTQILVDNPNLIQRPLQIYFKIDNQSFPLVLDMSQDICLGKVQNTGSLVGGQSNQAMAIWACEQRQFNITADGFMLFNINTLGIYAVIINPNPDVEVQTAQECGFYCQNNLVIHILIMAFILIFVIAVYVMCECCKQRVKTLSKIQAQNKRLLLASQSDSFAAGPNGIRRSAMPPYIPSDAFQGVDGPYSELDMDRVKHVLETVDPQDPPLMPGQVVLYLANQNVERDRQIEELTNQLQEQNKREKENLKLIKRIFHQKQMVYEQMQVQSEIKSQSRKAKQQKTRKRKEAINDPSIKKNYEDIEEYLSKILSETHLPDALDPMASAATFQQFPGVNTLRIKKENPADQSLQSIPVDQLYGAEAYNTEQRKNHPFNSDSMKHLLATQKNHQSTTDLEIKESKLKRKAADMLLRNMGSGEDVEEFKYNERAEQAAQLNNKNNDNDIHTLIQEEDKESGDIEINIKYQNNKGYHPEDNDVKHKDLDDMSGMGIDSATLSKTLNNLFSKAIKAGGNTRGQNMLVGGGAVAGSVSGNLTVRTKMERAMASKLQAAIGSAVKLPRQDGANGTFDDNSDESDDNLMPYEDQEEKRAAALNSKQGSGSKQKKSPKKK